MQQFPAIDWRSLGRTIRFQGRYYVVTYQRRPDGSIRYNPNGKPAVMPVLVNQVSKVPEAVPLQGKSFRFRNTRRRNNPRPRRAREVNEVDLILQDLMNEQPYHELRGTRHW